MIKKVEEANFEPPSGTFGNKEQLWKPEEQVIWLRGLQSSASYFFLP